MLTRPSYQYQRWVDFFKLSLSSNKPNHHQKLRQHQSTTTLIFHLVQEMTDAPEPHKKTKLEELDTTAPYADRAEDPTATAILRKKKKPNVSTFAPL